MTEADAKGLHFVRYARRGRPLTWYVYAWRGGPCIARVESPAKPKVTRAMMEALHGARADSRQVQPDTMAGLARRWKGSPEWARLAESTRKTWGAQLNAIEDKWGRTTLALWSDPRMVRKVLDWRDDRAATPRAADIGVMVLRELLRFARLRGDVAINVADGIPTLWRGGDRADILWTQEDIDRFQWEAVRQDQAHIADGLWLAALTGFRRADLVTASKAHVQATFLQKKALKASRGRRRIVTMPRLPRLDALLEELEGRERAEGVETLLVNSYGQPWTGDGFGGSFNRIRDAANIVHIDADTGQARRKHLHDVRGTFCTELILAGIAVGEPLSDEAIGEIMGWSAERVSNIRKTYVDQHQIVVAIGERIRRGL